MNDALIKELEALRDDPIMHYPTPAHMASVVNRTIAQMQALKEALEFCRRMAMRGDAELIRSSFQFGICAEALAGSVPKADEPSRADVANEPSFVDSLQGFASFCEACARDGGMSPEDLGMVIAKIRDASFVIDQQQKLRDELRAKIVDLEAENAILGEYRDKLHPPSHVKIYPREATEELLDNATLLDKVANLEAKLRTAEREALEKAAKAFEMKVTVARQIGNLVAASYFEASIAEIRALITAAQDAKTIS